MAKKKQENKNLYIWVAVAVVAVIVAIVVAVIVSNQKNNGGVEEATNSGVTASELDNVNETIAYGDYESMAKLAKEIQNGEATGKIVKIDGIVSHPMINYSVIEQNEDGTEKIGTQFIVEGATDADYPKDGDRIMIIGKVVEQEPLYFVIKTVPEYIKAL